MSSSTSLTSSTVIIGSLLFFLSISIQRIIKKLNDHYHFSTNNQLITSDTVKITKVIGNKVVSATLRK